MNNDNNDNGEHAKRIEEIAKRLAQKIRDMHNEQHGGEVPECCHEIMQRDNRGLMTDVANDFDLFSKEIAASDNLLSPMIGYIGHVLTSSRNAMCKLLNPFNDDLLHEMIAPGLMGYEEHGVELMTEDAGLEMLDLAMMACVASARSIVLNRIRKFCGTAEMICMLKAGETGPSVKFATNILNSIHRVLRLLDEIGVTFSPRNQDRFDLCDAAAKLEKYIAGHPDNQ